MNISDKVLQLLIKQGRGDEKENLKEAEWRDLKLLEIDSSDEKISIVQRKVTTPDLVGQLDSFGSA